MDLDDMLDDSDLETSDEDDNSPTAGASITAESADAGDSCIWEYPAHSTSGGDGDTSSGASSCWDIEPLTSAEDLDARSSSSDSASDAEAEVVAAERPWADPRPSLAPGPALLPPTRAPPQAPSPPCEEEPVRWEAHVDPHTTRTYFSHPATGRTAWCLPAGATAVRDWGLSLNCAHECTRCAWAHIFLFCGIIKRSSCSPCPDTNMFKWAFCWFHAHRPNGQCFISRVPGRLRYTRICTRDTVLRP